MAAPSYTTIADIENLLKKAESYNSEYQTKYKAFSHQAINIFSSWLQKQLNDGKAHDPCHNLADNESIPNESLLNFLLNQDHSIVPTNRQIASHDANQGLRKAISYIYFMPFGLIRSLLPNAPQLSDTAPVVHQSNLQIQLFEMKQHLIRELIKEGMGQEVDIQEYIAPLASLLFSLLSFVAPTATALAAFFSLTLLTSFAAAPAAAVFTFIGFFYVAACITTPTLAVIQGVISKSNIEAKLDDNEKGLCKVLNHRYRELLNSNSYQSPPIVADATADVTSLTLYSSSNGSERDPTEEQPTFSNKATAGPGH